MSEEDSGDQRHITNITKHTDVKILRNVTRRQKIPSDQSSLVKFRKLRKLLFLPSPAETTVELELELGLFEL